MIDAQDTLPDCTDKICGMGPVNMDNVCPPVARCMSQLGIGTVEPRMLSLMQMSTHPAQVSLLDVLRAALVGLLSNESILAMLA